MTTYAGNRTGGYNGDDIPATSAELYYPWGLSVSLSTDFYIVDQHSHRIKHVFTKCSGYGYVLVQIHVHVSMAFLVEIVICQFQV